MLTEVLLNKLVTNTVHITDVFELPCVIFLVAEKFSKNSCRTLRIFYGKASLICTHRLVQFDKTKKY
jgi:hypothetical protein